MAFCGKCGAPVPDGSVFCGHCGAKLAADVKELICKNCGAKLDEGLLFCPSCGAKADAEPARQISAPVQVPIKTEVQPAVSPAAEQELYRKKMIGYYKGPIQIAGDFVVTNKKITYTPMPLYPLYKPFTIRMNQVESASRVSVMGLSLCIRITVSDGKSHTFAFGIQNESDIDQVVDLINRAKQAA